MTHDITVRGEPDDYYQPVCSCGWVGDQYIPTVNPDPHAEAATSGAEHQSDASPPPPRSVEQRMMIQQADILARWIAAGDGPQMPVTDDDRSHVELVLRAIEAQGWVISD